MRTCWGKSKKKKKPKALIEFEWHSVNFTSAPPPLRLSHSHSLLSIRILFFIRWMVSNNAHQMCTVIVAWRQRPRRHCLMKYYKYFAPSRSHSVRVPSNGNLNQNQNHRRHHRPRRQNIKPKKKIISAYSSHEMNLHLPSLWLFDGIGAFLRQKSMSSANCSHRLSHRQIR